jgi:pilus assembly protein CpaF
MEASLKPIFEETLTHLLAPIRSYLSDDSVTEIMINGAEEIYIERAGRLSRIQERFPSEEALQAAARNIAQYAGKRLTSEQASIEARLPDGSRVHIVQPPAARKGLCIAIRRFSKKKLDLGQLVERRALTPQCAEFLSVCVKIKKNVMVSGGTGSGKTTLLNCLSAMIPATERIIVIEDSSELQLQQEHVVPFEAQAADRFGKGGISIRELFKGSLRMRPDRIIVGECRGGEALDMIQAMSSGHGGSMSTCHADTPRDALGRLETMALMGGVDLPLMSLRAQVASAVNVIVQVSRTADGQRRIVDVTEVLGIDDNYRYQTRQLFCLRRSVDGGADELAWSGQVPSFAAVVRYDHSTLPKDSLTTQIWADNTPGSPSLTP